ncbi:MAG: C45 family autoproteolytic acyltransferase/hydrolase [Promethearchaeota archaeon]
MKFKKKSVLLLFLLSITTFSGIITFAHACRHNSSEINYAEWKLSNGQPYLYVEADNYYDLGLLEGQNLAFQIAWMKLMINLQAQELGLSYDTALYYALAYLEKIPDKYIFEMQGIADGIDIVNIPFMGQVYEISIDFIDVLAQNCFWDIYYGTILPMLTGYPQTPLIAGGCTAVAARSYRKTIFAQTIDLSLLMKPTGSWVYTKINGNKFFSFRVGSMLAMGGVNKWGLSVSVNLLEVFNYGCSGIPLSIIYRSILENTKSIRQAKEIILSNNFTLGWNYILRNKRNLLAIETIPNSYSVERIRKSSFTFDANIYENSLFKMFMIYPTKYLPRYNRVSELCQSLSQDGSLNLYDLFKIYTDPLISRRFSTENPMEVGTVSSFFLDQRNNVYFCLGNPIDSNLGVIKSFD